MITLKNEAQRAYHVHRLPLIATCWHISPKNTNLVEDLEYLLPGMFLKNLLSGCRGKVKNVSTNQKPFRPSWTDRPEKIFVRGWWILASCRLWSESIQQLLKGSWKCLRKSETIFVDRSAEKNTNLVEDTEYLLPVECCQNPFRGENENVSANQRPGQ